jgi:hypothetical protein
MDAADHEDVRTPVAIGADVDRFDLSAVDRPANDDARSLYERRHRSSAGGRCGDREHE